MTDFTGKLERRSRKQCMTPEMSSEMDERRKWKNTNNA
jgi:hypothetical protein